MRNKRHLKSNKGQTTLILILVAAAALIFLAISSNWGRIAQTKSVLSMAAYQSASLLASDAASYGEMEKQQYLNDENKKSSVDFQIIIAIVVIIIAIIATILTFGAATPILVFGVVTATTVAVAALVMAVVSLALQLALIQPGICKLWNSLQKDQSTPQQFYEQGMSTALMQSVTDQAVITDYFDLNTNGSFGITNSTPNDTISRLAFFYTDRLKMLYKGAIPQVALFYNQLDELMYGETCFQNEQDAAKYNYPVNPACVGLQCCAAGDTSCSTESTPTDPACNALTGFVLQDQCTDSDPTNSNTYNPMCDPCCQPMVEAGKAKRPTSCAPYTDPVIQYPTSCFAHPTGKGCFCTSDPTDARCLPSSDPTNGECYLNNRYAISGQTLPLVYDQTYQEYADQTSFLDQMGRDQQMPTKQPPPPFTSLVAELQGGTASNVYFPNGVFPFFWLLKDYGLAVNTINPQQLDKSQVHWCVDGTGTDATGNGVQKSTDVNGYSAPVASTLAAFPELNQLGSTAFPMYSCNGYDCCAGFLLDTTDSSGNPTADGKMVIDMVGAAPPANAAPGNFVYANSPTSPPDTMCTGGTYINPAVDKNFGMTQTSASASCNNTWLEGDNQFCTANYPYSGGAGTKDGTCQWNDTNSMPASPVINGASSIDGLDAAVHTLSDFSVFAQAILNKSTNSLSSSFSSWYAQAAGWIAPPTECAQSGTGYDPYTQQPCDLTNSSDSDPNCEPVDSTCQSSVGGRLLSLYDPLNYPNIVMPAPAPSPFSPAPPAIANNPTPVDKFGDWNTVITNWLNTTYIPPQAPYPWCLPPSDTLLSYSKAEHDYIYNNTTPPSCPGGATCPAKGLCADGKTTCSTWGDLPHVLTCLNYNAGYDVTGAPANVGPVWDFNQCLTLVNQSKLSACPSDVTGSVSNNAFLAVCGPPVLDRSLILDSSLNPTLPPAFSGTYRCDTSYVDTTTTPPTPSFAKWVNDSYNLAKMEQPKFQARAQYLQDVYNRALLMQKIFPQAESALKQFMLPCAGPNCEDGGPAAQLIWAHLHPSPAKTLPNSVIYGWVDNPPLGTGGCRDSNNNKVGCAHVVKVTAYAPARNTGGTAAATAGFVLPDLPWIYAFTSWDFEWWGAIPYFNYVLDERDGDVFVSVKRWDQDHAAVKFPNGHTLWQTMFHNSSTVASYSGYGFPSFCKGLSVGGNQIGFGLWPQTLVGLQGSSTSPALSSTDQQLLANAFMLNDEPNGSANVDPAAQSNPGAYNDCLSWANDQLSQGIESHVCAEYIASKDASGPSSDTANDYSLKFITCPSVAPDDLQST